MLFRIDHTTRLVYSSAVSETVFEVRMAPPSTEDQTALGYQLRTTPRAPLTSYRDGFGNRVDLFNLHTPYKELSIRAASCVRTHRRGLVERFSGIAWPRTGRLPGAESELDRRPLANVEALEFLASSPLIDRSQPLDAFLAELAVPEDSTFASGLAGLMDKVHNRLAYEKNVTHAGTKVSEALELGKGVCQDYAHLFIASCRGLGLPARYVSGYVNHPGEIATHAWCQVWSGPAAGWADVDPTRGEIVGDDHIVTAVGRDYSDVPPNRGVWTGRAEETIEVGVVVETVERVPLEWDEWSAWSAGREGASAQGGGGRAQPRHPSAQRSHRPYPNQRIDRSGLRQQQGQQQQNA